MKIGIYNPRVGTKSAGGTETFLRQFISRCGEDVVLFTGEGEILDEVAEEGTTVHQIPVRYKEEKLNNMLSTYTPLIPAEIESLTMFINAYRSGIFTEMNKCDVISTHYYADNILISNIIDKPHIFHFHGIKKPSVRWRIMLAFDDTDRYVANSKSTARRMSKWYNLDINDIVYPGVDLDQFSPNSDLHKTKEDFVALYVGRLDKGKGVADLIDAVKGTDIFLRIVGEGNLRSQFEEKASENLKDNQYEFTGELPHEQIPEEYRNADVFSLPSYHESFGIVVMEALATGTPVITTRIDAMEEYIEHRKNGLLHEPGDVETLNAMLCEIKGSPELRRQLSERGRETANQYSWDAQTERMSEIYRKHVGQK